MTTRTVSGTALRGDETPYAGEPVDAYLRDGSYTVSAIYPPSRVRSYTNGSGEWRLNLWANADGLTPSRWQIVLPGNERHTFILSPGPEISLQALLEAQQLPGPWDEVTINDLLDARLATEAAARTQADDTLRAIVERTTGVYYQFLDLFRDNQDLLVLPRDSDIGGLTGTDVEGVFSIASRRLQVAAPVGTPSLTKHVLWSGEAFPRIVGRAFSFRLTPAQANKLFRFGFDQANNRAPSTAIMYFHSTGTIRMVEAGVTLTGFANYAAGVELDGMIVMRSRGMHYLVKPVTATTWTRLWASFLAATGPLYLAMATFDAALTVDGERGIAVQDFAAPWDVEEADSLLNEHTPLAGSYTADADGIVYIDWTAVAGQTFEAKLRWVDANNYLVLRLTQVASTIALLDHVAGVETTPSSANTKTFTFVPDTDYRISVRMDGSTMQVLYENTLIMGPSYGTHLTAQTIVLSHTVNELWFWPVHDVEPPTTTRLVRDQHIFYASSSGDDTNDGLTAATAVRDIMAALGRATGTDDIVCYCDGPIEAPLRCPIDWPHARNVELRPKTPGQRWYLYASQRHTAGWTHVGGGVWTKEIPKFFTLNLQNILVTSMTDDDGDEVQLTYVPGITNPAAGESSWNSTTLICYLHLPGDADPNDEIIETPLANYGLLAGHPDCTIRIFEGEWRYANISNVATNGATIITDDVNASYAITGNFAMFGSNGGRLEINGGTTRKSKNDNISVHGDLLGPSMTMIARDHVSEDADDEDISGHEICDLLVEDCDLAGAGNGGITSVDLTHMVIRRTHIHDNDQLGYRPNWGGVSFFGAGTSGSVEDSLIENNNGPGIYATAGALVTVTNTISGIGAGNTDPDNLAGTEP